MNTIIKRQIIIKLEKEGAFRLDNLIPAVRAGETSL
jgi:hypothetical protein